MQYFVYVHAIHHLSFIYIYTIRIYIRVLPVLQLPVRSQPCRPRIQIRTQQSPCDNFKQYKQGEQPDDWSMIVRVMQSQSDADIIIKEINKWYRLYIDTAN
jgi:hypothetical protein